MTPPGAPGSAIVKTMSVFVAIAFLFAGIPKLLFPSLLREQFAAWGYAGWLVPIVGIVETVGAVLLLVPRTSFYSAAALLVVMAGAAYTHVSHEEWIFTLPPLVFVFVLVAIMSVRRPR